MAAALHLNGIGRDSGEFEFLLGGSSSSRVVPLPDGRPRSPKEIRDVLPREPLFTGRHDGSSFALGEVGTHTP